MLTSKRCLAITVALAALAAACDLPPPVPVYAVSDRGGDRDGDGAADIDDACPDEPEDGLPPKANDGCPAYDADGDGILLVADKCPYAKEDGLPPNARDGCPTNDSDGDGVADAKDRCPREFEDNLDPDPNDGCPSADRDGDGIADARDQCKAEKETFNGYRDEDGCPDELPSRQAIQYDRESSEVYIPERQKVEFDTDSAKISAGSSTTLSEVAQVLKDHPEITRLEVEGHTSSKGDPRHNLDLSERRAGAVVQALTQLGIERGRLVPIGYGEYCPAVPSGDDVDEPKNRRVLFKAVVVNGVWQTIRRGCWRAQTASAGGADPTKRQQGAGKKPVVPASGGL
jgi:outer membrane protein OmpA-like peptidoglycan-associated protein